MLSTRALAHQTRRLHRQRGLSLVEMMVGVAVGLIVVAGASMLMSAQLTENRRLLIETQLQQDMRASMDIITRELRRVGAQNDDLAAQGVWSPGSSGSGQKNAYAESLTTSTGMVEFGYQQPSLGVKPFGFKLDSGSIRTAIGGNWQELTDSNVLLVTAFAIEPQDSSPLRLPCPRLCPDGTVNCWPEVLVRELAVTMTAEARGMPDIRRTLKTNVRLRNDFVRFNTGTADMCPA